MYGIYLFIYKFPLCRRRCLSSIVKKLCRAIKTNKQLLEKNIEWHVENFLSAIHSYEQMKIKKYI
jgi:hypothetical protein